MKTIVETSTNLSKYLLSDSTDVTIESDRLIVGDSSDPNFYVSDMNNTNTVVYTGITNDPDDWIGNKYTFDGTTWTQNPNWVDPEAE
jgi:hypothetical protein